jgi:hypothetical protein
MADIKALVDSGATDNFIHPRFIRRMGLGTRPLPKPKTIYNIDDSTNQAGLLTDYVDLEVQSGGTRKQMRFLVTNIGREDVLLGYPWLAMFEPKFSWRHGTIDEQILPIILRSINPREQTPNTIISATPMSEEEKIAIVYELDKHTTIQGTSTDLAIAAQQYTKKVEIPEEYLPFTKVFSEEESQ